MDSKASKVPIGHHTRVTFAQLCVWCAPLQEDHTGLPDTLHWAGPPATQSTARPHALRTSLGSAEGPVGAGRALSLPIDHAHVQGIVAEGLQAGQHAVGLAALEGEDLLLKVPSVPLGCTLRLPVVNLEQQAPKSGMQE